MKKCSIVFVWLFTAALVVLLLSPVAGPKVNAQEKPVARFYLFYGETCPHCHEVMDNFLPQVYEKYGDQVEYQYLEVWNDTDNYITLLGLEMKLGVAEESQGAVPALVIGDKVLIGADQIPAELETYIDEYLAQGGVDYPSLDDLHEVVLPTPVPAVQVLVIFDPDHVDLEALNDLIVSLSETYGSGVQFYPLDVTQNENADILLQLNVALGVSDPLSGAPQVQVDRRMLVGLNEIRRELPELVDKYLAQGGVQLPTLEDLGAAASIPTPASAPIHIAYFEKAGCQECARTNYDLRVVEERYPQVVVERFSIEGDENKLLNEWLCDEYGVPEEKRLTTPMLFVGGDVFIGTEANLDNLLSVANKYAPTGAEPTWNDYDPEMAEENLIGRFESWGVLAILGAGLKDGLNPCAFATLVFFISYMTFTGRRGRDILFVGIAFAVGVFLTYLLVGVGLLKVVQSLGFFPSLGRWVYLLTALICVILAVLTFRDFFRARRGQASEMTLKLPVSLRRRINKVIRESAQVRAFVAMAFVTGFVVSLIELACTGQVYYPTIVYVMSVPEYASRAFFYLLLYCLMFILPLIVVFLLSYFGTTSEQLGLFIARHVATVKALTALVFVGLALWMTWTLAPLFDANAPWNWALVGSVLFVIIVGSVALQAMERTPSRKRAAAGRRRKRR